VEYNGVRSGYWRRCFADRHGDDRTWLYQSGDYILTLLARRPLPSGVQNDIPRLGASCEGPNDACAEGTPAESLIWMISALRLMACMPRRQRRAGTVIHPIK